jgi:hypothetical protein
MDTDPVSDPIRNALMGRLKSQLSLQAVNRRVANPLDVPSEEKALKEAGAITHQVTMTLTESLRSQRSEHEMEAHGQRLEGLRESAQELQRAHVRRLKELMKTGMTEDKAEEHLAAEQSAVTVTSQATDQQQVVKDVKRMPEYWLTVGAEVAKRLPVPLTCDLAAGLTVYELSLIPHLRATAEVVELKSQTRDNHFVVVVDRDQTSSIGGDPAAWGAKASVIDVWAFLQNKGPLITTGKPSILSDMRDAQAYPRTVMTTIPVNNS